MRDLLDYSSSTTSVPSHNPIAVKRRGTRRISLALLFLAGLLAAFVPGGRALAAGGVPVIVIHPPTADLFSGETQLFGAWICPTDSAGNPIFGDNGVPDGVDDGCILIEVIWFVDPLIGNLSTTTGNPTTFTAAAFSAGTTVSGQLTATPTTSTLPGDSVTINVTGTEINVVPITCVSEEGEEDKQEQTIGQDADGNEIIAELKCARNAFGTIVVNFDQVNNTIGVDGSMVLGQTLKDSSQQISIPDFELVPPGRPFFEEEFKGTGDISDPVVSLEMLFRLSDEDL